MKDHGITSENVHYWTGSNGKLVVDLQFVDWRPVAAHPLQSFADYNAAVNFLFVAGWKDSAREINKHFGSE